MRRILLIVIVVRTINPSGLFSVHCEMCSVVGLYRHGNEPIDSVKEAGSFVRSRAVVVFS
jgi:hypothetical protein